MAHQDKNLAAIQTKVAAGSKVVSLHPDDTKAILAQISSITDPILQRRITYAAQHNITISLTTTEMAQLVLDIGVSAKGK